MKYRIEIDIDLPVAKCRESNFKWCPYFSNAFHYCRATPDQLDIPHKEYDFDDPAPWVVEMPPWCPLKEVKE